LGGRSRDRRCWSISRRRTSLWSCSLLLCLSSPQRCDGGFDLARRLPCASARARPWTRSAGHRHCAWPTSVQPCRVRALTTYIDGVGLGHGVALILLLGVHAARVGRSRVIASHNGSTSPGDLVGRPARRGHPVGALVASVMTAGTSEPNRRLARPVPLLH
jgi:hypothetical protein